jgi:hypothetical protein
MLTAEQIHDDAVSKYLDTNFKGLWNTHEGTFDSVGWINTQPTAFNEDNYDAGVIALVAEYAANQYARDRAEAYPSLQDQADMQFHDAQDGTTTWADAIAAVKEAHPKP